MGGAGIMPYKIQPPLAERLKRESHRICAMILNSDVERIDVLLQINQMREMCLAEAPEKAELFDAIYTSRFDRLWGQWRGADD
jgi:hypothetical protein